MKKFFDVVMFVLTGKGACADEMVELGLIDYSGQGRNEFGK
jgi:hypothetical protein